MPIKRLATDDQIIDAYAELRSAEKVAEKFGIGQSTTIRILKKHGVELSGLAEYRTSIKGSKKPWTKYVGSEEEILALYNSGASMREIARKIGRSVHVVARRVRAAGIVRPFQGSGPDHSQWKGERIDAGQGYWRVWVSPDDPVASMRDHHGYVKEHRLVLARKIGRPLLETETAHHIDGDRGNNDPANLQLRQGKHGKHVVMCCLDCGSRNIGHAEI